MKPFLFLLAALICSCSAPKPNLPPNKKTVRLTVYWKAEDGWTRRGFTSTGEPLISYKTIAADPKDFPYYTKVEIPEFGIKGSVVDTGSALRTRKAAREMGRDVPVLDLYVEKRQDALDFIKGKPYFVDVYYSEPEQKR
jgi:3D (Asp-Asp-Asp) domain-containing protein